MRRRHPAAVLAVAAAAATIAPTNAPASSRETAARTFTIRAGQYIVNQIGSFKPRRDPSIAAAIRAFGDPSSQRLKRSYWCVVRWKRLRLTVDFMNYGYHPDETTCAPTVGLAQRFVVKSHRFVTWKGLRVGDPADLIPEVHPPAEFRQGRWWLRTAFSPLGEGGEYAVITADVGGRRRVNELAGEIGAAGE
jgi:hypothetical protein